jgi:hypothetical protein
LIVDRKQPSAFALELNGVNYRVQHFDWVAASSPEHTPQIAKPTVRGQDYRST